MKYLSAHFLLKGDSLSPEEVQTAYDIITALAGEAGFDTFDQSDGQLTGYAPAEAFDQHTLDALLSEFPLPQVNVEYHLEKIDDEDWNATWEATGFEPIVIEGRCVIHDTLHESPTQPGMMDILIDAKMAFGTGTHETTQMMVKHLLDGDLQGRRVLDCGCGTGILSIVASKAGAEEVVAYDIDEWSVENTRHNATLNGVDNIEVLNGDIHVLSHVSGIFDVVLANINRNVLLSDMEAMKGMMTDGGRLLLSGFYESDIALLLETARRLDLKHVSTDMLGGWVLLSFTS